MKIGFGRWGGWTAPLGVLLCFGAAITAQPGFLSIDCGGKKNYSDANNIKWVTDANYIDHLGQTADIGNVTNDYGAVTSLRFFPKPLLKSCYHLPVDPHVPYLLRLWFAVGNYGGIQQLPSFAFSLETMGTLYMKNLTISSRDAQVYGRILASSGTVIYVCLIRIVDSDDPFISAIELRKLQDGMYGKVTPGTILEPIWRTDVGGNSIIRYPQDKFDRIWTPSVPSNVLGIGELVNSSTLIHDTEDFPPPLVMQTAWLLNSSEPVQFYLGPFLKGGRKSLLLLYFAETQMLKMSESRSFYVLINGEKRSDTFTIPRNYSSLKLTILSSQTDVFQFALVRATNSTLPPLINAFEYCTVFYSQPATNLQDIEAVVGIKEMFNMTTWISDPCFLIPWNGIICRNNASAIRISEINLSTRNLTGLVPQQIGQLTALVNVFSGNPYLSIPDSMGHMPLNPNNKNFRKHLVLGITLSGVLIIGLSLIAGIFVFRKKKECVTTESNGVENVVYFSSNEWTDSTIMVPSSTKSCAFTLDQMMTATQNFSENIGKGGFGSVFFGKLPEGKEIAVKVLSFFSRPGIHQFLNEIDVLSRVHHENLVTLLGYCNECKKLMIVYENMSGGSLRDRLYGLEYMHGVCTPKIIHRDVKTANILLDNNLKGKLGDFGLSKIWIDGEASHVSTTVKGTAGYLDPEYFSTERLTDKSDVYSFGVVLLEIICGRRLDANLSVDQLNIIQWATPLVEMDAIPGKIEEIIDRRLGGNYNIKSLTRVAKVAVRCVKAESFCRPAISEVVAELREAIKLEETYSSISNVIPEVHNIVDLDGK